MIRLTLNAAPYVLRVKGEDILSIDIFNAEGNIDGTWIRYFCGRATCECFVLETPEMVRSLRDYDVRNGSMGEVYAHEPKATEEMIELPI